MADWEELTPAQLNELCRSYGENEKAKQELRRLNMYQHACLIRAMVWAKSPPSYREAFGGGETPAMTDMELYEQVRTLNILLGGEDADAGS